MDLLKVYEFKILPISIVGFYKNTAINVIIRLKKSPVGSILIYSYNSSKI